MYVWTIYIPKSVLATNSNSNRGASYTCVCLFTSFNDSIQQIPHSKCAQRQYSAMREISSRAHSTRIFPESFPECSGTKISYGVSVSTFQLPIIEQIALNQICLHGLFFVIWVQRDYRIMTELCLKWWQTTWILRVMCSPLASLMLLYIAGLLLYVEQVQVIEERGGSLSFWTKT